MFYALFSTTEIIGVTHLILLRYYGRTKEVGSLSPGILAVLFTIILETYIQCMK